MDSNILLAKIVANPTDSTWAQVYSTLNLYVALSFKSKATSPTAGEDGERGEKDEKEKNDKLIAAQGKELLERIQREYFSQDIKNLENIKKSIEDATNDIEDLNDISIVLANITGEILYLVVLGANVILKRSGKVATIAAGTPGKIEAYSGKIRPDDVIILETEGFAEKITLDKLSSTLDHLNVSEIAENLAPLVHADPEGDEAAVILQYKKIEVSLETEITEPSDDKSVVETPTETNKSDETQQTPVESKEPDLSWENSEKHAETEADDPISHLADESIQTEPKKSIFSGFTKDRKTIIIVVLALLVVLFVGSIFYEKHRKEVAAQNQVLNEILDPNQKKFDEANALISLNKGLALNEFNDIKASVEQASAKLPESSPARKKLDEFLSKVNSKINELSAGATLNNQKKIFDDSSYVVYRGKQLYSTNSSGKISVLSEDGTSTKTIDSKNSSTRAIGANDNDVFVAGTSGISSGAKVVVKDPGTVVSLDTFGSNLYALNTSDKTVDKYPTGSYTKSSYFTEDVTLNNPSSMSIDSSVWIVDSGKVRKFTKGKEDSFTVTGLTKEISTGSLITTNVDYEDIYVLDPANKRIVAISKDGAVKNQYVSKDLSQSTSFAVDEPNKKMFVVISGKLYSFDL